MAERKNLGRLALSWERRPLKNRRGVRMIAHRGFRGQYPENTMSAFRAACGRSNMVELDVHLSADGAVVISHDDRLSRCSDAATLGPQLGMADDRVWAWPLSFLRQLDMGGWFQGRGCYLPSCRERLPLFAEVLAWARKVGMPLDVELKDQYNPERNALLVRKTVQLIVAAGHVEQTMFCSFSEDLLKEALRLAPFISRAWLIGGPAPANLIDRLAAISACALHPEQHDVDQQLVDTLHAHGIALHVWTVNEEADKCRLLALGVDGLITDWPEFV